MKLHMIPAASRAAEGGASCDWAEGGASCDPAEVGAACDPAEGGASCAPAEGGASCDPAEGGSAWCCCVEVERSAAHNSVCRGATHG